MPLTIFCYIESLPGLIVHSLSFIYPVDLTFPVAQPSTYLGFWTEWARILGWWSGWHSKHSPPPLCHRDRHWDGSQIIKWREIGWYLQIIMKENILRNFRNKIFQRLITNKNKITCLSSNSGSTAIRLHSRVMLDEWTDDRKTWNFQEERRTKDMKDNRIIVYEISLIPIFRFLSCPSMTWRDFPLCCATYVCI